MRLTTLIRTRLEHVRNERSTRARIEARQLKKFRRLVTHAARHSPYYQDIIKARGIDVDHCVPQDFPVLTKTGLMDNFDQIITDRTVTRRQIAHFLEGSKDSFELYDNRYYVLHSSGTSGEVGYMVYSCHEWARGLSGGLRVNPPGFGRRRLAYLGATEGHFAGVSFATSTQRSATRWIYDVATYDINAPLGPTLDGLNAFQPTTLMGYATALAMLAEKQLEGRLEIAPGQIQSSGEPVTHAVRERVEQVFGVPLLNVYSPTEHLIMGLDRPEYDGMYLFEDDLIFEFGSSHALVTNLFNFTMPLIRYRMSDVFAPAEDDIQALPFIKVDVVGRNENAPIFLNEHGEEDFIHPIIVAEFFAKNLRRFQLELEDRTRCTFRICLEPGLSVPERERTTCEVREKFGAILAQKEMRNVHYRIEVVDDLPVDPRTGKFRLIVPAADDQAGRAAILAPDQGVS